MFTQSESIAKIDREEYGKNSAKGDRRNAEEKGKFHKESTIALAIKKNSANCLTKAYATM